MHPRFFVNLKPNSSSPTSNKLTVNTLSSTSHSPSLIFFSLRARGGFRSGGSGFEQNRCPSVEKKFTDYSSANRPLIGSGGRVGWAGLAGGYGRVSRVFAVTTTNIENQPNNKNHQITATTKIIKSPQQKTKQKISKYKLDRTGEVEGGAAAKLARSGQNPTRSR